MSLLLYSNQAAVDVCTVEPWLSESPSSKPLPWLYKRYFELWNLIRQFDFLQNQVINGILVWF